jgi:3-hydroxyisobutyrate dehydrogenase-like beta-hydroxyacid dehydrogenase
MGAEMVAALADQGFSVIVWNRTPEKAAALAAATGAQAAESPASASGDADVVVTMLTDGDAVLATLSAADGVLAGARAGTVVVDCSTIGAEAARQAAALCAKSEVGFIDSPVSGSTVVARQGKLGLMVGGDASVIERVSPVLAALGTVVHVGPTGAGAATKVAVNGLLHTFSTALSECLVAARTEGVSVDAFFDVLATGVLWNRFLDYKRPSFSDPDNTPVAFDLRTATKDLALAVAASNHAGLTASVVVRAHELHQQALDDGFGDRDMAAMAAWFAVRPGTNDGSALAGAPAPGGQPERN